MIEITFILNHEQGESFSYTQQHQLDYTAEIYGHLFHLELLVWFDMFI